MSFPELDKVIENVRRNKERKLFTGKMLAFDPGHTTGICNVVADPDQTPVFQLSQVDTKDIETLWNRITQLFTHYSPNLVVIEDYRVYEWKSKDHSWSQVHTIKVVGAIQMAAFSRNLPVVMRMAAEAKGFVTDDKLKAWELYRKGERHARDACRHAVYELIFGADHHFTS